MKFVGLLLKESLIDESVLDAVRIAKVETWNVDNAASFQPAVWTAVYFEGDERQADVIAEKLSRSLKPAWYCNISTESHSYVIFPTKVFKYPRGDQPKRAEAQEYGRSLGIPDRQLDWGESFP